MKKSTLLSAMMYLIISKSLGQEVDSTLNVKMDSLIVMLAKKDYVKELKYFDKKKFLPVCQCGNINIELIYTYRIKYKDKNDSINVLLINSDFQIAYPRSRAARYSIDKLKYKLGLKIDSEFFLFYTFFYMYYFIDSEYIFLSFVYLNIIKQYLYNISQSKIVMVGG